MQTTARCAIGRIHNVLIPRYLVLAAAMLAFGLVDCLAETKPLTVADVVMILNANRTNIAAELTMRLQRTNYSGSYTTVWRQHEDAVIQSLEITLPKVCPGLGTNNFDSGSNGREKNRLADFAIRCGTNAIEVSIKSSRASGQPENDMGTFNEHPRRKAIFSDSFTVWVRYDDSMPEIKCDRVFFDRTWRFVGKSTLVDGVKYRKKDGNMRPKPWVMFDSGQSFWKTEAEFEAAVKRSESFRANELIREHLQDMSEQDQRLLYEKLKERFTPSSPAKNQKSRTTWSSGFY